MPIAKVTNTPTKKKQAGTGIGLLKSSEKRQTLAY